jgi:hypothetical protein
MTLRRLPLAIAVTHLVLVALTAAYISASADGQAPLLWLFWYPIDLPISLVYSLPNTVLDAIGDAMYLPYLVHGVLGTVWWYALSAAAIRLIVRLAVRQG